MSDPSRPSDVSEPLALVLDDNLDVPVARVVEFELALLRNPTDVDTRRIYRDWLLEQGCTHRAEQLNHVLTGGVAELYTGPVRPERPYNWFDL
jgi:uncharacterized protein (TIGR02996 family)